MTLILIILIWMALGSVFLLPYATLFTKRDANPLKTILHAFLYGIFFPLYVSSIKKKEKEKPINLDELMKTIREFKDYGAKIKTPDIQDNTKKVQELFK